MKDLGTACPCSSKKSFAECCDRFLSGAEHAKTPEQLMRSRYTAHALGGYGDYLVCSWWAAVELGLTAADFAGHSVNWCKLEVLDKLQQGDYGEVEFKAYFYPAGVAEKDGDRQVMHERSTFKRVKGIWYYVDAK